MIKSMSRSFQEARLLLALPVAVVRAMGVRERNSVCDLVHISTSPSVWSNKSNPDLVSGWVGKLVMGDHRDSVGDDILYVLIIIL
jgi:hypothetical protein